MSLRKAYAATLQWLRVRRGLSQADFQDKADQGHISRLEASSVSASVDLSADLAKALGLRPLSFLTLVAAADEGKTARSALDEVLVELRQLGVLDEVMPREPQSLVPPQTAALAEKLRQVQELKRAGLSQTEISVQLGMPRTTVRRMWHAED
ncbi:helix-turn-helix domain-containing protein [Pseudomonas sp. Marseille-Q5117]|uniref:helix-turn-helix domain-containing protein n=1 Tax=Pseudomonas sp. Marseille-Q5117 TaxID=2972777 RepID=UPI0021C82957|nr:helix-turn-helix transcriptional regulator [Pseudomonas sp. Marseille-Q5117]